jgi:hypothetical protein
VDKASCALLGGSEVSVCSEPLTPPASSSSAGTVEPPASSSSEAVKEYCMVESECQKVDAASCALLGGTMVKSCSTPVLSNPSLVQGSPYKLYDLKGHLVRSGHGEANLRGLQNGVYIVKRQSGTQVLVAR